MFDTKFQAKIYICHTVSEKKRKTWFHIDVYHWSRHVSSWLKQNGSNNLPISFKDLLMQSCFHPIGRNQTTITWRRSCMYRRPLDHYSWISKLNRPRSFKVKVQGEQSTINAMMSATIYECWTRNLQLRWSSYHQTSQDLKHFHGGIKTSCMIWQNYVLFPNI